MYAIVDAEMCGRAGREPAEVARAFMAGGARLLQLRCKTWDSGAFLDLARTVVEDAQAAGATVVVNDRADITVLSGAHGLHVGQEDLAPADARTVIGMEKILGLSTHTPAQWNAAVGTPISYLAIGPVFGSATKHTGYTAVGLDVVSAAASAAAPHRLPVVAIGGITLDNVRSVIDAGAASVAIVSDLLAGDPEARVRAFLRVLD